MNMCQNSYELRVVSCELNAGPLLATRNSQLATSKRGFTLIEMITVLTIIIIVLAIAIPIWDALMNGTNLSAAQNQISAFISNARTDAIYNRQTIGVFFYVNSKTQQTGMAEVQVQTLYQANPYTGTGPVYTSLFKPGTWTTWTPPVGPGGPLGRHQPPTTERSTPWKW